MKLLVIPTLYPSSEDDIKGIFILDYIKAVQDQVQISVLDINLKGRKTKGFVDSFKGIHTFRYHVKGQPSKWLTYLIYVSKFRSIAKLLRDEKFDVIHIHGSVFKAFFGRWYARRNEIPYFVTEHTGPFSKISRNPLFRRIAKRVMEDATCLFTVSDDLFKQIKASGIHPPRYCTTYNPVDTDLFIPTSQSSRPKAFIFVGRLEDYKGAFRVLKALLKVQASLPDWKLIIIGDGPELSLIEDFSRENNLQDKVVLKGKQTKAEIAKSFHEASVFVYPSEHETFGLVIAEAMSSGLPVVVGNQSAPPEFVDADQGLLIDPSSVDAIASGMLSMAERHQNFSPEVIREKVVRRFSFAAFGTLLMDNYKQV